MWVFFPRYPVSVGTDEQVVTCSTLFFSYSAMYALMWPCRCFCYLQVVWDVAPPTSISVVVANVWISIWCVTDLSTALMVLMRVHDVLSTTAQASRPLGVTNAASAPQKARSVLGSCWFCGTTVSFSMAVCGSPVIKCQHLAPFVLNKIALMFFLFCRGALVLQGSGCTPTLCPVWILMSVMKLNHRHANTSAWTHQAPTSVPATPTFTWSRITKAARAKVIILALFETNVNVFVSFDLFFWLSDLLNRWYNVLNFGCPPDEPLLLASVQSELWLLGIHRGSLTLLSSVRRPVFSLDYHWAQQRVYWLSPDYQSIRWADIKKSNSRKTLIKGTTADTSETDVFKEFKQHISVLK